MRRLAILAALLALAPAAARADFTMSVESKTVSTGDVFTIDVVGTGTTASAALNDFGVQFQIAGGAAISLQFVNNADALDDPTLNAPGYIFSGDSSDATPPPVGGVPFGNATPDGFGQLTNLVGGDSSNSGGDYALPAGGVLLARLRLVAPNFVVNPGGDTYTITLVAGANTYFSNSAGDETLLGDGPPSGTVRVMPAGVPEPGSLALLALGGLTVGLLRRRRGRADARGSEAGQIAAVG